MQLELGREQNGEENGSIHKKQKVEAKYVKDERLEKKDEVNGSGLVKLGRKKFVFSVEMFDDFNKLLRFWRNNLDLSKIKRYGHMCFVVFKILKFVRLPYNYCVKITSTCTVKKVPSFKPFS
ncbi:unnamed protein product [Microthlaspi erraticum]|uniref:Uncharacterized protein n=1 Tax=Microthlaspi erraticum TaxID=1685480 RepID=A0A6D2IJJ6_9BRAS|nr:unnamed protein product [Microthlaspi erraticum]